MRTTILLCAWLLATLSSFGANPSYTVFRGTGGVSVTTNPPTGLIVIDGSGVFTSSGTNATLAISTNGVLVAVASTNINFIKGTNVVLTATNIASTTHIGIHAVTPPEEKTIAIRAGGTIVSQVATQLNVVGGPNIVILATNLPAGAVSLGVAVRNPMLLGGSGVEFGTWSDTAVGFSNASSGVLSLGNLDPGSGDNWTFAGNVIVLAMPGTGNGVAISAGGILGRTNFVSNITLLSLSNALVLLSSNVAPAPPLNSVQFNSNGVQQGSADFLFANGVATVGQGVEVTTGSFVLNGGATALVAWNGLGRIRWDADGVMRLENDAALGLNRVNLGGTDAGFPAIGRTNGDVIILGANGAFKIGGSTNRLIVPAVHIANDGGVGTPLLSLDNPLSAIRWDVAIDSNPQTYFLGLGRVGDTTPTMVWELGGNVGINTTNPTTTLDVQGRTMLRSNIYFPNISSNATPVALLATDSQGEVYEFAVPRALAETNAVLTNLVGTVAGNVTNVVSLSTTNATSKPLTNAYANGTLTLFGVEAGANITITPNGSNLVIAASASGGGGAGSLAVNDNQFVTNSLLNFKSGALTTNLNIKAAEGAALALTVDTNVLVVTGGRVGVGTTSPARALDVYDTNGIQVSSQSRPYTLGNGQWYGTPVPYLRPATANNGIAFDIMPHTIKTNVWIDICSDDFMQSGNGEYLHLEKLPDGESRIGSSALGTGTVRDLRLQPYGGSIYYGLLGTTVRLVPNQAAAQEIPGGPMFWAAATNHSIAIGPGATQFDVLYNDGITGWRSGLELISPAVSGFGTLALMKSGGNVGIGTTTPTNRLDVSGHTSLRSNVWMHALPTNATPIAFLATDAAGQVFETAVPAGSSGFAAGNSNQIPFINVAQTGYTYAGYLSQTNPGFGFSPSGPHGGYGGLMVFGNSPMGLVTIGHPNAGSDFETFATALVISNRYNGAADFKNDMVKVDAVIIGGGLRSDSTMTRWRVWQGTTSSNDVAELNLNGQIKLYGGTLYRSNTVALPTAAELGAGGYWVGVSNNGTANSLVSVYSLDGSATIMKVLVP